MMVGLKTSAGRVFRLYRQSKYLAFVVDEFREARLLRRGNLQWLMDEAHRSRTFDFESPLERQWHRHLLSVLDIQLGKQQWGEALEIGCSEGVFTADLACRCRSVTALDISSVAQARAAHRCAQYANVKIGALDLARGEISSRYDLIFVMDVLCLISGRRTQAQIAAKLSDALRDGGWLVFSDSRMPKSFRHRFWSFLLPTRADVCSDILERAPGMRLAYKDVYPAGDGGIPDYSGYWDKLFALFRKSSQART